MINHLLINRILSLTIRARDPLIEYEEMDKELISFFSDLILEQYEDMEESMNKVINHIPRLIVENKMRP